MKHDPTIRTALKSTASRRSVRSPQRKDGILLKPSNSAVITHRLQKAVFDDGRPRNVDYGRDSRSLAFASSLGASRIHGNFAPVRRSSAAQMQAWNINPDALKSGYCLTLRLPMGLAERQQRYDP